MKEGTTGARFSGILVRVSLERRREVYKNIEDLSTPTKSFYVMVAISTTIAAYGLLANSTAVVIGAMLVAPLMGPIFGIALSLSAGDRRLLPQSAFSEVMGVILAVALGVLIGLVPLRLGFGSEIMARTQPTLYDIIIALASGLAGAYALVDPRISPALPGVAIATALVPPLATCGLCLAAGRWEWAMGAFLLFFANFLAIQVAAAFVFTAFGLVEVQSPGALSINRFVRRFSLSLLALAIVAVFMTRTLVSLVRETTFSRTVEKTLSRQVRSIAGAQLSEFRQERNGSDHTVIAVVLTPQAFEPAQVEQIEKNLREEVDPGIRLVIRSLISKDADRSGTVFISEEERERRTEVTEQTQFLTQASQVLNEQLEQVLGAHLTDIRRTQDNGQDIVTAVVSAPGAISPEEVAGIEDALRQAAGKPVRLIVRSILTRDADAQQYLYVPQKKEARPLTGEALRLHRRLESALKNQIRQEEPGATLTEFRYARRGGRLLLLAIVRTPRNFTPSQAREIEAAFRRYVHPGTDLIIRSVVGTDTAGVGYLRSFDETRLSPPGGGSP